VSDLFQTALAPDLNLCDHTLQWLFVSDLSLSIIYPSSKEPLSVSEARNRCFSTTRCRCTSPLDPFNWNLLRLLRKDDASRLSSQLDIADRCPSQFDEVVVFMHALIL